MELYRLKGKKTYISEGNFLSLKNKKKLYEKISLIFPKKRKQLQD